MVKSPPALQEMWVRSLGGEDPPEEDMATHSSILAWRIPGTEEPGGLQPVGSQSQTRLSEHTQGKVTYPPQTRLPSSLPQTISVLLKRITSAKVLGVQDSCFISTEKL